MNNVNFTPSYKVELSHEEWLLAEEEGLAQSEWAYKALDRARRSQTDDTGAV